MDMGLHPSSRLSGLFLLVLTLTGCLSAQEGMRSLTILHSNDLHARLNPDPKGRGGFAYLATTIRQEKSTSEGSLVLNAGDLVQGTPVSSIFEGVPCYEIASQMGFDVNTLGNHEFDYGLPKLLEFINIAGFPTVSANVAGLNGRLLTENAYIICEVNGLRVAQGRRIDPNRDYVLATNDFIGERWESEDLMLSQRGPLVREALIEWIKANKVID